MAPSVLLIVMFIPAAVINVNIGEFYKKFGGDDPQPAPNNPNLAGPGQRPGGPPRQQNPNPMIGGEQNNPQPGVPNANAPHPGFAPQGGNERIFLYNVTYNSFTGQGSVEDSARSALKTHPGFVEDSLKVNEEAKTIAFQLKGGMAPPALSGLLRSRGFPSVQVEMSSQ